MPDKPIYKRILVKLSGEALMGEDSYGINQGVIERIVGEIGDVAKMGVEIAVVIGGKDRLSVRCQTHFFELGPLAVQFFLDGFQKRLDRVALGDDLLLLQRIGLVGDFQDIPLVLAVF